MCELLSVTLSVAISATVNQDGRSVAFMSRSLQASELPYPPVQKEATATNEAVRKCRNVLAGRHFTLIMDQHSVASILEGRKWFI